MIVKQEDNIMEDSQLSINLDIKSDYKHICKEVRKKQDSIHVERNRRYRQKLKNDPQRLEVYLQKDRERKKKVRDLEKLVGKSAEQLAHDREVARLRQQRRRSKLKIKAEFQGKTKTVFTNVFSLLL